MLFNFMANQHLFLALAREQALPLIEGSFQYQNVNVAAQRRDPNLLLNWIERAIRLRKEYPEFGWGDWRILEMDDPVVFAHSCQWQSRTIVAVHNLSSKAREIKLGP